MNPATVHILGDGIVIDESIHHPAGNVFSGGYNADTNELYLSSQIGHPRGVALAGGDPSAERISGLRLLVLGNGDVYWADDSMSLPRRLMTDERTAIQQGLESHFGSSRTVRYVAKLEDIPN